jgi:hypothetical protein
MRNLYGEKKSKGAGIDGTVGGVPSLLRDVTLVCPQRIHLPSKTIHDRVAFAEAITK